MIWTVNIRPGSFEHLNCVLSITDSSTGLLLNQSARLTLIERALSYIRIFWSRFIREHRSMMNALDNEPDTKAYLRKRLECNQEEIDGIFVRVPLMYKRQPQRLKDAIDTLYSESSCRVMWYVCNVSGGTFSFWGQSWASLRDKLSGRRESCSCRPNRWRRGYCSCGRWVTRSVR